MNAFAAVDLGASSGRVMVGRLVDGGVELTEAHRFPNRPVRLDGRLHWDISALHRGVLDGLRAAGPVSSVGIDSWAVDYGLLDADGALVAPPVHYRDARAEAAIEQVLAEIPLPELYAATGIQFLPFNTLFQLAAAPPPPTAERALLIPDLISHWLTGTSGTEVTNASTTALLDPRTRQWSPEVASRAGVDVGLFPPLRRPGDPAGVLRPEIGLGAVPVRAVGSHDTASAVVGVPAEGGNFAYISSGTWSLVGVELDAPVLSEAARLANFTNEAGVDGTTRFLRNVTGLWILQECQRVWRRTDTTGLIAEAAALPRAAVVDVDDARFLPPGDMPSRIADACRETGQPVPGTPGEITRCVLDSLAEAYRKAIADAVRLTGRPVDVVHVVGGGARNELLCQLTADACQRPVVAGPVEATALGNVLVQARAHGVFSGGLADMRAVLRRSQRLRTYLPR
ncbi:rhamnulokinase [Saccharopolyspora hirsuta]|uniref:Rhamnulokinase n=1 Tax=Saccharopolyspora hirsuta TaxID=1837 RepID=A0A5M7BY96_SACHI|nr:rhamnulokinase family protein [Saccharopolyspora hirsuta]KAA5835206.1 rhamnulokinase [Saccharopolyspora hirsuta]